MVGRSLELYFVDGTPDGLVTAEMFNWTGHVVQVPRIRLKEALGRDETGRTGVYILIGESEDGPLAYIGETENVGKRLQKHATEKPWWERAYLVTTASDLLHKAHVSYLESRLVKLAKEAGQLPLENANQPAGASLPEAAQANMENFIENLLVVLPALKVDLFSDRTRPEHEETKEIESSEQTKVVFEIRIPKTTSIARAEVTNGEMVVLKGSAARAGWVGKGSYKSGYQDLREQLIKNGVLTVVDGHLVFTKNYAFQSVSAAANVVLGRSSNGRTEWKIPSSQETYAEWEEAQLSGQGSEA